MSPFSFLGVASFFIGNLFDEPLYVSWGCLFFHWRTFLMSHFVFLSVASFSLEFFFDEPFTFLGVASFFIGCLFDEPMNKGSDSTPLFMAPRVCTKVLIEC
jgi:hypothetical protein